MAFIVPITCLLIGLGIGFLIGVNAAGCAVAEMVEDGELAAPDRLAL